MQYLKHCFLFFFSFFYLLVPKCVSAWLWERERERETRELKTKRRRRKRVVHLFVHTNVVFRLGRRPWLFSRFQFRFRQLQGNKKNNISRQLFGFKGEVFFFFLLGVNWVWLQDHYKVLELNSDASDDEIRSNFIRLALVPYPNLCPFFLTRFCQWWELCLVVCCRSGIRINLKKRIPLRLGFKKSTRLTKVFASLLPSQKYVRLKKKG